MNLGAGTAEVAELRLLEVVDADVAIDQVLEIRIAPILEQLASNAALLEQPDSHELLDARSSPSRSSSSAATMPDAGLVFLVFAHVRFKLGGIQRFEHVLEEPDVDVGGRVERDEVGLVYAAPGANSS